ncbi:hypothetical protein BD626DRAFT_496131 [Schizophyllum amplum]|uniref:Uncharacterized protein n=1 Tax=Schizophyllum amplum TaxID=97359 RepID=A0A550CER5_9AGAR|nr:hypothetical protein BD626DRAFT_496131 [Auriculariopsis ampla]
MSETKASESKSKAPEREGNDDDDDEANLPNNTKSKAAPRRKRAIPVDEDEHAEPAPRSKKSKKADVVEEEEEGVWDEVVKVGGKKKKAGADLGKGKPSQSEGNEETSRKWSGLPAHVAERLKKRRYTLIADDEPDELDCFS